jgi:hypothetical protein
VKGINFRAALISLFLSLAVVTSVQTGKYYFYQTPTGALAVSNKKPPSASKIISQLSRITDREVPQGQEPDKPQLNVEPKSWLKPSKNKQP